MGTHTFFKIKIKTFNFKILYSWFYVSENPSIRSFSRALNLRIHRMRKSNSSDWSEKWVVKMCDQVGAENDHPDGLFCVAVYHDRQRGEYHNLILWDSFRFELRTEGALPGKVSGRDWSELSSEMIGFACIWI